MNKAVDYAFQDIEDIEDIPGELPADIFYCL